MGTREEWSIGGKDRGESSKGSDRLAGAMTGARHYMAVNIFIKPASIISLICPKTLLV